MSVDTGLPASPEATPSPESGGPKLPVETIDGNDRPETRQVAGEGADGRPNRQTPQPIGDEVNAENEGAPQPTSARRVAANRENATRSTGPKTEQGKTASSKNAIKHGFFAGKLLDQTAAGAAERTAFEELGAQLRDHVNPVGFKEQLLVEQIFAELVRQGRILRYEEEVLSKANSFYTTPGLEKIVRYSASNNRQMARLFEELENEQLKRKSQETIGANSIAEQPKDSSPMAEVAERAVAPPDPTEVAE